jgi:hypothetical protein
MSADLLTFLQGESRGPKRDMIARCYYEVAQGDPKSGPVAYAVLLDACAECFATVPKELREANEHFKALLSQARDFEGKLLERMQAQHADLVSSLKTEVAKTTTSLQAAKDIHQEIARRSKETVSGVQEMNSQVVSLIGTLYAMKLSLQNHQDCAEKTAEAAKTMAATHETTKKLVKELTDQASIHWISIGVVIGFFLTLIAVNIPWLGFTLLALAIGLLQWLARTLWQVIREQAGKMDSPAKG